MKKIIFILLTFISTNALSQDLSSLAYKKLIARKATRAGTDSCAVFDNATFKWMFVPCSLFGSGTVISASVVTANGFSGTVANPTTTPAITIVAGAITPTSVNGVTLSGSSTPTLAVTGTTTVSGVNTGNQTITLTGDATGSGTGSFATTLTNTAVTPGSYTNTNLTVDSKGRITAASNGTGGANKLDTAASTGTIPIGQSYGGLALKTPSGDVTITNAGVTAIGSSKVTNAMLVNTTTTINGTSITLGGSGTVAAAAGTLTGTTLNSTVVSSSLSSVGTLANLTVTNPITGSVTGNAATVTTIPTLSGEVSNSGNAVTLLNSAVIGKVLTGYTSGAGTVSATDNIIQAFQKINGNVATNTTNISTNTSNIATIIGAQAANTIYAGPISGGLTTPTFRSVDRRDLNNIYTEVGSVFSEPWTNLTSWTNVGTPAASVSGGQLTIAGTASLTTNYIRCSGYGNSNLESATYTWTETVGTIGVGTSGKGFSMQCQGLYTPNCFSVEVYVELSTTNTGVVKWNYNNALYQTSATLLSGLSGGSVITCKLTQYPDRFLFEASSGSSVVNDILYIYAGPGSANASIGIPNAYQYAFFNHGGTHTVGAFGVTCRQVKNPNILIIGNSIAAGYGNYNFYNRAGSKLQERYYATVEILARPNNIIEDINLAEVTSINPKNVLLWCGRNNVAKDGAATAFTSMQTAITALGVLGYSTANGNLSIATEIPDGSSTINTYNTSVRSTYTTNVIELSALINDGTNVLPKPLYSVDGTHPNAVANTLMADKIASFYGLIKREIYKNEGVSPVINQSQINGTTQIGKNIYTATSGTLGANSTMVVASGAILNESTAYVATNTSAGIFGMDVAGGFGVYGNTLLTVGNTFTPAAKFNIDASGNISTGSTKSVVYRTTNAGSNVSSHFFVDPNSSLTSGVGMGFNTGYGIFFTLGNGTRRVEFASIVPTTTNTSAGSEAGDLAFYTQSGGTVVTEKMRITGSGLFGIGLTPTKAYSEIKAGTSTIAPLAFTSGTDVSSPTAGLWYYNGTRLGFSPSTTIKRVALTNDAAPSNGQIAIGNGTDYTVTNITSSGGSIIVSNGSGTIDISTAQTLASGTFTPALTNVTNVTASTAYVTGYYRIGSSVTVYGKIAINSTLAASTATEVAISLPVASNFAAEEDLGGTAVSDALASETARIKADATNDRASVTFKSISISNDSYSFEFSYQVK